MSETNNRKRLAVGIFIFAGLVILVTGVLAIGGQRKAFVKTFTLRSVFSDVQGLQSGNNVWLAGMKVGTVKKVAFYGSTGIEVIMNIEQQALSHIRKDAHVRVSTDGLVGSKIVVIEGGSPGAPAITTGDELPSEQVAGTRELLTTLQTSNANLLEITGNLRTVSGKLAAGEGTLGELINDPSIADRLRASITHLQTASAASEKMIAHLESFTGSLTRPGTLAGDLVTDTVVFHHLRGAVTRMNEAATAASQFSRSLQTAGEGLNNSNTPLGLLLHDEETAADLQRTIKNLRISSKQLSEDLEAAQHNFLLRGFFKKHPSTAGAAN